MFSSSIGSVWLSSFISYSFSINTATNIIPQTYCLVPSSQGLRCSSGSARSRPPTNDAAPHFLPSASSRPGDDDPSPTPTQTGAPAPAQHLARQRSLETRPRSLLQRRSLRSLAAGSAPACSNTTGPPGTTRSNPAAPSSNEASGPRYTASCAPTN